MGQGKKLPEEKVALILKAYVDKVPTLEILEVFDISGSTLRAEVAKAEIPRRGKVADPLCPKSLDLAERRAEVLRLVNKKWRHKRIARFLEVSTSTVHNDLVKAREEQLEEEKLNVT